MHSNLIQFPANISGRVMPITPAKVEAFLGKLDIRVFDGKQELTVTRVYLGDNGDVCVDVTHAAMAAQGAH